MKKIPFKVIGEKSVDLWYYGADSASLGKKRPCILWIHGGGWQRENPQIFGDDYLHFTRLGLVCFSVDYRLIPPDEDLECKNLKCAIEDCIDAFKFIRQNADKYGVDPDRIAVLGESAGGHLALCLTTKIAEYMGASLAPNMAILYNPVVDITGRWAGSICNYKRSLSEKEFLDMNDILKQLSPIRNIRKNSIPTLFLTGLIDKVVYPSEVYDFYLKNKEAGNESEIVFYENTDHAFLLPEYYQLGSESREDSFVKIEQFMKKHSFI